MVYKSGQIFLPFCHNPRVWQTDGLTDGRTDWRTDRILITIPRLHYMQRGKNRLRMCTVCCSWYTKQIRRNRRWKTRCDCAKTELLNWKPLSRRWTRWVTTIDQITLHSANFTCNETNSEPLLFVNGPYWYWRLPREKKSSTVVEMAA